MEHPFPLSHAELQSYYAFCCIYAALSYCLMQFCFLARRSQSVDHKHYWCRPITLTICWSVGLSVGWSVRKVYCGKTAEWIRVPFGLVSGVG